MKAVAIVGKRGGAGKTSVAHLLALGAAWKMIPAHFMHTDDREPITVKGRPYAYYDARNPETLSTLMTAGINSDGLCIIDGGGNRPDFDKWIAEYVDLVIIPVAPDEEDVRMALEQEKLLVDAGATNVRFLINKYPSNKYEKQYVDRFFEGLPTDKIIGYLPSVMSVRRLRVNDIEEFKTMPANVNNLARKTYSIISEILTETEKNSIAA